MTAYTLNLLDLLFTLHAISHGGVELNPLMQTPPIMIFYKIFVVGALCWWLSGRNESIAHTGLKIITAVFAVVNAWHIVNIAPSFWAVLFY